MASLEIEVAKWKATARTVLRVEHPKVANSIIAFVEAVRSNHQLSSKVGSVLAKLLCTRLHSDELFKRCKDLQVDKKDLVVKLEGLAMERDELVKVVDD